MMIKLDATGFQRVGLVEDGFRRSLGLGLWIPKAKSDDLFKEIRLHKLG